MNIFTTIIKIMILLIYHNYILPLFKNIQINVLSVDFNGLTVKYGICDH